LIAQVSSYGYDTPGRIDMPLTIKVIDTDNELFTSFQRSLQTTLEGIEERIKTKAADTGQVSD
jgi:hypothetical protein